MLAVCVKLAIAAPSPEISVARDCPSVQTSTETADPSPCAEVLGGFAVAATP